MIKGAHWFGRGWPVNFWTTDLLRYADQDFAGIKADGFNTVILVVPWLGFVDPFTGEIGEAYFRTLDRLIERADAAGLSVVLRVGYSWNHAWPENPPYMYTYALVTDSRVFSAWTAYVAEIGRRYGSNPAVALFFTTWEDIWALVHKCDASVAEREEFGRSSGFGWTVPGRRTPEFSAYLDFVKDVFLNRFYTTARAHIPRLSAEVRLDQDLLFDGDEIVGRYDWSDSWALPGSEWVVGYYNPYFGAENNGSAIDPTNALSQLESMLYRLRAKVGDRRIFLDQFNIRDDTPGLTCDYLRDEDLPKFLRGSGPLLSRETDGYAFWFWRGYSHDVFSNPDFSQGLLGWRCTGRLQNGVRLAQGEYLERPYRSWARHAPGRGVTLNVAGEGAAELDVFADGEAVAKVRLSEPAEFELPPEAELRLTANGDLAIKTVNLTAFTQEGVIHKADGSPGFLLEAVREFNANLKPAAPLYQDGWMARRHSGSIHAHRDGLMLEFKVSLPPEWPHQPDLDIAVGRTRVRVGIRPGLTRILLPLEVGETAYSLKANSVKSPAELGCGSDERGLSCKIEGIALVEAAT